MMCSFPLAHGAPEGKCTHLLQHFPSYADGAGGGRQPGTRAAATGAVAG